MAQPEMAAGDANNPVDAPAKIDPIDALVDEMLPDHEEEQQEPEAEAQPEAGEQTEAEPEAELPPIDAPVSWTAEEKAKFAELPREVQETLSRRETERERFVQSKATEASRAKQEAERTALSQVADIHRQAAEQLQQLSAAVLPQQPDPRLLQGDENSRAYFYQQEAIYRQALAQHQQLQQEAGKRAQQADAYRQELTRREAQENVQVLQEQFPEYLDPANAELRNNLASTAQALGYSPEQIAQARAPDILAMKTASDWKAKADKYDQLMRAKMQTVREAKKLPPVAKPGTVQPPAQRNKAAMEQSFENFRQTKDYGAAADFLSQAGWM